TGLTLEKALEMAYQNSKNIQNAELKVSVARKKVHEASAGLLPSLSYGIVNNKASEDQEVPYFDPITGTIIPSPVPDSDVTYSGNLSLTQKLYTGGVLTGNLGIAKLTLEMTEEDLRKAKQNLTSQVKEAYYGLWFAEQALRVVQSSYENMGKHYQRVKRLYDVGSVSKYELLQAQVRWESLKPTIIKAENGVKLARLGLANLIGSPVDNSITIVDDFAQISLPVETNLEFSKLLDEAYRNRPEVINMAYANEQAKLQTKMARAGYKPNLALSYDYSGGGLEFDPGDWEKKWNLTLSLTGVLFDGFATASKVSAAKDNQKILENQESLLRDAVRIEVEQGLLNLQESLETIQANQSQINLSKETLRMTQARFDAGMATTIDISDSQLDLDNALNGYYASIKNYLTALAKLDVTLGRDPQSKE
ncbi:MAG: TolC family protein, partial [Bacteroidota bacterium]